MANILNEANGIEDAMEQNTMREETTTGSIASLETMMLGSAGGNGDMKKVIEAMVEERGSEKSFKIVEMDKNRFKLGVDTICIFHTDDNGHTLVEAAILEGTGKTPVSSKQLVEASYTRNYNDMIVTTDAFGDALNAKIEQVLKSHNITDKYSYLGGVIIPAGVDATAAGRALYRRVHDVMVVKSFKDAGGKVELSDLVKGKGFNINIGYNLGNQAAKSLLGSPRKNDFRLDLSANSARTNVGSDAYHNADASRNILSTAGRVDYIVSEETNMYTGAVKKIAQPMIIVTDTVSNVPTLGHVLMGISNTALTFANRATMRNLIVQADAGPLNMLFNFGGEPNKLGEKISFADPKADPQVINDIIREHVIPQPIYAVEVSLHDEDYSIASPLAALGGEAKGIAEAEAAIRTAAAEFTGSRIEGRIIEGSPIVIPKGYFIDNSGEQRDIAELLDTAFVAKHASDIQLVYDVIFSNLPKDVCIGLTGKDPYMLKLEILTKLAASLAVTPIINGRSVRIVLHGEFVGKLSNAMSSAGYNPTVIDPNNMVGIDANLQNLAAIYAGGHVTNMAAQQGGYGMGQPQGMYGMPQMGGYGMY